MGQHIVDVAAVAGHSTPMRDAFRMVAVLWSALSAPGNLLLELLVLRPIS
jgi:hypothetical protein